MGSPKKRPQRAFSAFLCPIFFPLYALSVTVFGIATGAARAHFPADRMTFALKLLFCSPFVKSLSMESATSLSPLLTRSIAVSTGSVIPVLAHSMKEL